MGKFGIYYCSSGQILLLSKLSNVGEVNRGAAAQQLAAVIKVHSQPFRVKYIVVLQ